MTRSWRPLAQGGAVVGAILALSLVTLAPSLVYWAKHGRNDEVAHRLPAESELFGLKFAQLVLPIQEHRISALADLRQSYDDWSPTTEAAFSTPLGLVGTAGFLVLLGVSLLQLASPGRPVARPLLGHAGIAALAGASLRLDRRACDAGRRRSGHRFDPGIGSRSSSRSSRCWRWGSCSIARWARCAPCWERRCSAACSRSASSTRRARPTSRRMRRSRPSTEATASSCRRSRSGCRRARWSSSSRTTRSRRRPGRSGWPTTT